MASRAPGAVRCPQGHVTGSLLLAVALTLAACGGSEFTYVANREEQVFFKIPEDWGLFEEGEVIIPNENVTAVQAAELRDRVWLRGFDGSERPSAGNVLLRSANDPRGYAEVRLLAPDERESVSLVELRRSGFPLDSETGEPIDPIAFQAQNPGGPVRILHYEDDIVLENGSHGTRVTALLDDDSPSVFDQFTFVDAATTRRYIFTIGCSIECWTQNEGLIAEIADSWTLEETP
ncbi:MAG: hypothetical protein ACRDZ9_03670 [Acidimicrobiales bacterium]